MRDSIDVTHVRMHHFDKALSQTPPSLTTAQLDQYAELQRKMDIR